VTDDDLRALVTRVISGHSDDDGVCEPEDAAEDILRIIDCEVDSRLKAMRAAMFAVNFDFAQQAVQAYERAVGK
jgi:hypothetical protein